MFIAANDRSEDLKQDLADQLGEARERTRWLLCTVSDEDLIRQHDRTMSP